MCALPRKFKKNINIQPNKIGVDKRREIINDITYKGTNLPKGVSIKDMDTSFIEFVKSDLNITINGKKLPVIFLTIQRWNEFSKNWEFTDKYKNIKMPFITIVRKPNPEDGTNQGGLWNTAAKIFYQYIRIPKFDGIRKGMDVYKIPQPIAIDMLYEVRMFCNKMDDLNKMHTNVRKIFRSRQFYINPKGHPMPITIDNIGDESSISDFESRRFYTQLFDLRLQGYIMDENEFKLIPSIDRSLLFMETTDKYKKPMVKIKADKDTSLITYNLIFKPLSDTSFSTEAEFDIRFNEILGFMNINSLTIKVNSITKNIPFVVSQGDEITFTITKPAQSEASFTLNGNLL